jgi:Zn-dependent protease with chaperone function
MARSLYPPSPEDVPHELTAPSGAYRLRVWLLVLIVVLFFALYFSMVAGAGYLIYWGITKPAGGAGGVLAKIGLIAGGALGVLFLIRGLAHRSGKNGRSIRALVTPEEQPRLWRFIEEVCDETGAALPVKVYVSFEVGASASLDVSPLSLIWPTGKNLHIGQGLVNVVNLSEFKAILAHEFGHFAQGSMRLGIYANIAGYVISAIVFGRDSFDDLLQRWRRADPAIAWLGWCVWGLNQALNYCLFSLLKLVVLMEKSLSRQMEFQADRVAVSVAGSDAIVHGLSHAMWGDFTMEHALNDLELAANHGRFSEDLFHHHSHAIARLRKQAKNPKLGDPPPLPQDRRKKSEVFNPEDEKDHPTMWLDHPPNWQREDNAKEIYLRTDFDERSAWLLFDRIEELCQRVTFKMYRALFRMRRDQRLMNADAVQALIDEEYAETTYDERYHGMYDNRPLRLSNLHDMVHAVRQKPWPDPELLDAHANLYDPTVRGVTDRFYKACDDCSFLEGILYEQAGGDEFQFRGRIYETRDAKRLLRAMNNEMDDCFDWLADRDRRVFLVYQQMADRLGQRFERELMERYRFHLQVQDLFFGLAQHAVPLRCVADFAANCPAEVPEDHYYAIQGILADAWVTLCERLNDADHVVMPRLANLGLGQSLSDFLFGGKLKHFSARSGISVKRTLKFIGHYDGVLRRSKRMVAKSMGGLLRLQESIEKEYVQKRRPARAKA